MTYLDSLELDLTTSQIFSFFHDLEKWFRLNPQWQVISFVPDGPLREGGGFALEVEYDREERKVAYQGLITTWQPDRGFTVTLSGDEVREIAIEVLDARFISLLKFRETSPKPLAEADTIELKLWLKSVANYILISHRTTPWSRSWKWFLDRYWLKMTPSGRRTVFFVVAAEGLSLVFFLLILMWLLIFKKL